LSRYFKAEIRKNISLHNDYNLLTFAPLIKTEEPKPGQFYMLGRNSEDGEGSRRLSFQRTTYDPLLKRPFSLFRRTRTGFQILFRVRGRVTTIMRDLRKGSLIDVIGPLGNSYPLPAKDQTPLIVAGGVGIASLFSLAETLARLGNKGYLYYGACTEGELLMLSVLKKWVKQLHVSTDDGSCGERGTIVDLLEKHLPRHGADAVVYTCGPRPMLEMVGSIVKERGIPAFASMEEYMACGIGACLGCVVKTVDGHRRVCKEGPVFPLHEILW
jgi:dihydroorotate dehydrogenase electron transfer subunit